MSLTTMQENVLSKMKEGWVLGTTMKGPVKQARLQQGGLGSGGTAIEVSRVTLKSLRSRGFIAIDKDEKDLITYKIKQKACNLD